MSTNEKKEFLRKYVAALSGKPKPAAVVEQYGLQLLLAVTRAAPYKPIIASQEGL